jgi:hypothetical protein
MRMSSRLLAVLLAVALSLPALTAATPAFAQSAGDDQYVDPFEGEGGNGGGGGGGGNNGGDNSGSQGNSDTGAGDTTTPTDTGSGDTAGTTAQADDGSDLPRSGLDVGPIALIGVILIAGGLALRRAWPLPE